MPRARGLWVGTEASAVLLQSPVDTAGQGPWCPNYTEPGSRPPDGHGLNGTKPTVGETPSDPDDSVNSAASASRPGKVLRPAALWVCKSKAGQRRCEQVSRGPCGSSSSCPRPPSHAPRRAGGGSGPTASPETPHPSLFGTGPGDPVWVFTRPWTRREGAAGGRKGRFPITSGSFQCDRLGLVHR